MRGGMTRGGMGPGRGGRGMPPRGGGMAPRGPSERGGFPPARYQSLFRRLFSLYCFLICSESSL